MSKKKQDISFENLITFFERDVNESDIRLVCVIGGCYLDYLLSKNLEVLIKNRNPYIDNLEFHEKLSLLQSLGFFDADETIPKEERRYRNENVLNDIKILNNVRNHYAHNIIDQTEDIQKEIKQKLEHLYLNSFQTYIQNKHNLLVQFSFKIAFNSLIIRSKLYEERKQATFYFNEVSIPL